MELENATIIIVIFSLKPALKQTSKFIVMQGSKW